MFLTEDYLIELEDNFPSKVVETLNRKGKDLTSEDINEQANRENQSMRQRLKIMARKRIAAMSNQELKDFLFPKTNEFQSGDQSLENLGHLSHHKFFQMLHGSQRKETEPISNNHKPGPISKKGKPKSKPKNDKLKPI